MKITAVSFEIIASCSGFHSWIDANSVELGFDSSQFAEGFSDMWDSGKLSDRHSIEWCKTVINREQHATSTFWDKSRPYYIAIQKFMEEYELKTIRFDADF